MKSDRVVYDLLQHAPLEEVLAFVNARDDVRAMAADEPPPASYADTIPCPTTTTRPPSRAPSTLRMGLR